MHPRIHSGKLVEKHISKKKLLEKAKPWWLKELKELRKEMTKYKKKWKKYSNIQAQQEYQEARATYYYKIKKVKLNY